MALLMKLLSVNVRCLGDCFNLCQGSFQGLAFTNNFSVVNGEIDLFTQVVSHLLQ